MTGMHQALMQCCRALISTLHSACRIRESPIDWVAMLPGRQQQHAVTCAIALGLPSLELQAVRKLGVDKEGELRVFEHSSKTWQDRLVVLRRNFLLSFQSSGASDRPPCNVLRIDPDSDVVGGFGDSRTHPVYE